MTISRLEKTRRQARCSSATLRSGAALLVVLFVTMVVAVLSMAVLVRANRQMLVADNGAARLKLDYLAESGLVHAKTLLLHPQEVATGPDGYWQGQEGLQIETGRDYYDVLVMRPVESDRCTYRIVSTARRDDGKELGSRLEGCLRLDPCIALWMGAGGQLPAGVAISGDVYCAGALTSSATINGDVFAEAFSGNSVGRAYPGTPAGVTFPEITSSAFSSWTTVTSVDCNHPSEPFEPDTGVLYSGGTLLLNGDVDIIGTLVVDGDLTIRGGCATIRPLKNGPAAVVSGRVIIESGGKLDASGLVQADAMTVGQTGSAVINGAVFLKSGGVVFPELPYGGEMLVRADAMMAAVRLVNSATMTWTNWSPAGGAFFKYVKRVEAAACP